MFLASRIRGAVSAASESPPKGRNDKEGWFEETGLYPRLMSSEWSCVAVVSSRLLINNSFYFFRYLRQAL